MRPDGAAEAQVEIDVTRAAARRERDQQRCQRRRREQPQRQVVPSSARSIARECIRLVESKAEARSVSRQASSGISWRSFASCKLNALTNIPTSQLALLVIGAAAAGLVQGISGFAFGMVAMSIWAWGIDPVEATTMAVFGGLCGQVLAALTMRRRAAASELLPFLVGGLIGVPIGTSLLPHIGAIQFKLLLGVILVISCPLMLAAPRLRRLDAVGRGGDGAAGVAGGVIGGISGMTGVAPAIWCVLRGYDKSRQRELLQNFNLAILTATMAAMIWRGAVSRVMVPRLGIVAIALILPAMLGAKIYRRLSDASFRRMVLVLLTLSGIALIASAMRG